MSTDIQQGKISEEKRKRLDLMVTTNTYRILHFFFFQKKLFDCKIGIQIFMN